MIHRGILFQLFLLTLLWPSGLLACSVPVSRMRWDVYAYADAVLRARVTGYRYDGNGERAFFDLGDLRALNGHSYEKDAKLLDVPWQTPGGQAPPKVWTRKDVIVGLTFKVNKQGGIDVQLLDAACDQSYILDDTQDNRRLVQASISLVRQQMVLEREKRESGVTPETKAALDAEIDRLQAIKCKAGVC
jgi:hypothetical protein